MAADGFHRLHPEYFEPSPRWVRAVAGGVTVASSRRAMLLRPPDGLPAYYFPAADVRQDLLAPAGQARADARYGPAALYHLAAGGRVLENAAWSYTAPPAAGPALAGYFAFEWKLMDAWFEEDEQVYVHARDPYKRLDVCQSSRHVAVFVAGTQVADSRRPYLLFETGLPTRYYLPKADVRMDLLVPSETHTQCPYKGTASYYSIRVGDQLFENYVWYYPFPIPECPKIENRLAFYNEKVDLVIDGEPQARPQTKFA
ncbi:MAG: DUF427 domain-containing protein [Anaerolineales bacterium]|nr:DUF427 domain-containing protein [Anaerolineales bacterium]